MRKFLTLSLAVALFVGIAAGFCFAEPIYTRDPSQRVSTVVVQSGADNNYLTQSTITSDNNIIGFTLADSGAAGLVTLHDAATEATCSATNAIAEATNASGYSTTIILPLPYDVENGVTVYFSSDTAVVTIYYE